MTPLLLTLLLATRQSDALDFHLLPSGTFKLMGGYRPFSLNLSDVKPDGLRKAPDMASPRYGSIKVGAQTFLVALDGEDKLYVDSNGDGDLTDDPAPDWGMKTIKGRNGQESSYRGGSATIDIEYRGNKVPCTVGLYQNGTYYGYYMDFSLTGTVKVGGKSYNSLYLDESGAWDGTKGMLIIDEKGDGRFGPAYFHPVGQPFMLAGKEYEFGARSGAFAILPSTKKIVPPVEVDPNLNNGLRAGSAALAFEATTLSGQKVSFPTSFKGKVVMLDFWATWCGPCMREAPNVVKAYNAYHGKGFEVLGVSLDQPDSAAVVKDVTGKQGMPWEQVYDGKYFKAAVAQLYKIQAIPAAYLVDGDTGKIIAFGEGIRGEKLADAIEKALGAKRAQNAAK
jgi:thiol-disulfide isomerase/thioredoxin